jgi:glycosyltransferase involved in cell wall biosynthesis
MTAPGWAPFKGNGGLRREVRERLGIPEDAFVFGIVGSLDWNPRVGYCYGWELVEAIRDVERKDVVALVVGDGSGLEHLREAATGLNGRVVFAGRIERESVPGYLDAMDVGSLPQSIDGVGAFRYTTKISEYAAAGLPIVTAELPLAYDFDNGGVWRLPGESPWDPTFLAALRRLMNTLSPGDLAAKRAAAAQGNGTFDFEVQQRRVSAFVADIANR